MQIAGILAGVAAVTLLTGNAPGLTGRAADVSSPGWKIEPTPAAGAGLLGVSCSSTSACTAVGSNQSGQALAERWNGTTWALQTVPQPTGSGGAVLDGVSCPSASECVAVGDYLTGSGAQNVLAERWNGKTWTLQSAPGPGGNSPYLKGVSCPSASACTAVGYYNTNAGGQKTLAERWNGKTWALQHTANPSGPLPYLQAVSCASTSVCTAVGYYGTNSGGQKTLAEGWNGTAWTLQQTANPGGSFPVLAAVSCPSATTCTAVGNYTERNQKILAETWDGTSWTIQKVPVPAGSFPSLSGVSCPTASICTGTGTYDTNSGWKTLAERWDGTAWAIQPTPNPSGSVPTLDAVSCPSATSCAAVGDYQKGTSTTKSLAERYA